MAVNRPEVGARSRGLARLGPKAEKLAEKQEVVQEEARLAGRAAPILVA